MALIVVLLTLVLLTMLSTSFVQLARSDLFSSRQYHLRVHAQQACDSGLDYARANLAQYPGWADIGWGASHQTLDLAGMKVFESGTSPDDNVAEGQLPNGATFKVRVQSNFQGVGVVPPLSWSKSGVNVPRRSALVRVESEYQGVRREVEAILIRRSTVGQSLYAGQNFAVINNNVDDSLTFSSTVAHSNRLKVEGNIYFPDDEAVLFEQRGGAGRVSAGLDVFVNSAVSFNSSGTITGGSGTSLHSNDTLKGQVGDAIGAQIRTQQHLSPLKFEPGQLRSNPPAALPTIPEGNYHFTGPNTVRYTPTAGGDPITHLGSMPGAVFSNYRFLTLGESEIHGNVTITGELTRRLYAPDGTPGDLEIIDLPVSLGVGYSPTGLPLPAGETSVSKLTVHGNLTVKGDLIGAGQLHLKKVSGSGGNLSVIGNSRLSATRTDGMALTTEGDVYFGEVSNEAGVTPFAMSTADFALFNSAADAFSGVSGFTLPGTGPPQTVDPSTALDNWRTLSVQAKIGVVGDSDEVGPERLRNLPLGFSGTYLDLVSGSMLDAGNTSNGQPFLARTFEFDTPAGPVFKSGSDIITALQVGSGDISPGVTLGKHVRMREFIKSVERGAPDLPLVNVWSIAEWDSRNNEVQVLIANQVSAYDQDARAEGKKLSEYFDTTNPYLESMRRDFVFGGLLYAAGNLYAHLNNTPFILLGAMMAQGDVGFQDMVKGDFVFDPTSFEDQFELSKLGLRIAFYWSNS